MNALKKKLYLNELKSLFLNNMQLKKELLKTPSNFKHLITFEDAGLSLLSYNNPSKLNALNFEATKEYYNWLQSFIIAPNKLPIYIGDKNSKIVSSGGDLKYMYSLKDNLPEFYAYNNLFYYILYKNFEIFSNSKNNNSSFKNSIFFINGLAMGQGLCQGIFSNIRIATESSLISMPESRFGHFANGLFSEFICKMLTDPKEALFMSIFCNRYKGYELFSKNFATHFILNKHIRDVIYDLKSIQPITEKFMEIEKCLNNYQEISMKEYYGEINKSENDLKKFEEDFTRLLDFEILKTNNETIDFEDFYENLKEKVEKMRSNTINGLNLKEEFNKRSLLSLKMNYDVTMAAYNPRLSFEKKFNMEMDNFEISLNSGEIFEGIRAYFIDKDKKPKWRYNKLDDLNKI